LGEIWRSEKFVRDIFVEVLLVRLHMQDRPYDVKLMLEWIILNLFCKKVGVLGAALNS
jgi:hypothetical protein